MHHYIWTKKEKRLIILFSILISIVWVLIIAEAGLVNHNKKITQNFEQIAFVFKSQIQEKQEKLNYRAQKDAIKSPNKKIRESSLQIVNDKQAEQRVNRICKVIFTFNNAKEYKSRKKLLKTYVESDVLNNSNLFASDKDSSGKSFINNSGLHYQYVSSDVSCGILDNHQIPILIKVVYNYWFTDYNKVQVQQVYSASYNSKTKKVSNLTKLSKLSETKLNN